jgi:hypothetical protein
MKDKKWKLAVWGMLLATMIIVSAIFGFFMDKAGALSFLGQGIGLGTLVLGMYATANVAQKKVISENYIPEKDGRCAD